MKKITHYEKIRQVLDFYGIEDSEAEQMCQFGVGTISKKKGTSNKLFQVNVEKFLRRFRVERAWWDRGELPMLTDTVENIRANEPEVEYKSDMNEVYKTVVAGGTEYLLIPKSILNDEYRIIPVEKIKNEALQIEKERESNNAHAKEHAVAIEALSLAIQTISQQFSNLKGSQPKHSK